MRGEPHQTGGDADRRRTRGALLLSTVATAAFSLLAVSLALAYLVAPTRTALAVQMQVNAAAVVPSGKVVVYGKATDRGKALPRVRIALSRSGRIRMSVDTAANGTFKRVTSLKSGSYALSVSRRSNGRTRTAKARVKLKSGRAYRVTVRLVRNGGLSILPIRSY